MRHDQAHQPHLKVLYLVPPSRSRKAISMYSFISEEVAALMDRGIIAYVVTPHSGQDYTEPHFHKISKPPLSIPQILSTIRFMLVNIRVTLPLAIRNPLACATCARLEMRAAQLVRDEGIHIIHSHFGWPTGVGGAFVKNQAKVPLITSIRGMDILVNEAIGYGNIKNRFFGAAFRALLRQADAITCVSQYIRREALSLGAPPQKTTTILKGVDLARFKRGASRTEARSRLRLQDKFTVLSVGGLIARKGMDHLLKSVARIERDVQCVICGSGPKLVELQNLTKQLGIEHNVTFRGQVSRDEIPRYFEAADVFVLASINEASGNVLIEAAAMELAIITTASGGPPEYVAHEQYGYIVEPGDVRGLAARIRELVDDPNKRAAFGERARDAAAQRFGYDRMIQQILSIYDGAVVRDLPGPKFPHDEALRPVGSTCEQPQQQAATRVDQGAGENAYQEHEQGG